MEKYYLQMGSLKNFREINSSNFFNKNVNLTEKIVIFPSKQNDFSTVNLILGMCWFHGIFYENGAGSVICKFHIA